jgi:phosphoglycolate phosphatase
MINIQRNAVPTANFERVIAHIRRRVFEQKDVNSLIFDLDGVMINSREANAKSLLEVIRSRGYRPRMVNGCLDALNSRRSPIIVLPLLVPKLKNKPELLLEMKMVVGERVLANAGMIIKTPLVDMLPELKASGIPMAIATNRSDSAMPLIERLGIGEYFTAIVNSLMAARKPSPEMITLAIRMMGADPASTLFIGDNREDFLAGRAGGVFTILVQWHN